MKENMWNKIKSWLSKHLVAKPAQPAPPGLYDYAAIRPAPVVAKPVQKAPAPTVTSYPDSHRPRPAWRYVEPVESHPVTDNFVDAAMTYAVIASLARMKAENEVVQYDNSPTAWDTPTIRTAEGTPYVSEPTYAPVATSPVESSTDWGKTDYGSTSYGSTDYGSSSSDSYSSSSDSSSSSSSSDW